MMKATLLVPIYIRILYLLYIIQMNIQSSIRIMHHAPCAMHAFKQVGELKLEWNEMEPVHPVFVHAPPIFLCFGKVQ